MLIVIEGMRKVKKLAWQENTGRPISHDSNNGENPGRTNGFSSEMMPDILSILDTSLQKDGAP